jgi:hypothetical protein
MVLGTFKTLIPVIFGVGVPVIVTVIVNLLLLTKSFAVEIATTSKSWPLG